MKIAFKIQKMPRVRAQAMVEFALVLMILLMVLVGILEVGRLVFIYAAVNNASREAVRYASAIGLDDSGHAKYQYCDGIRSMARRSAFFTPLTVTITYDHGPGTATYDNCDGSVDTGVVVNAGTNVDRVQVQVSAQYDPMVRLVPIASRTITSVSARTIFGYVDLATPVFGSPNTPTPAGSTTPHSPLSSDTPTASATPTLSSGIVVTLTALPTSTATPIPTISVTSTQTPTPTVTYTPTTTFTAVPGCNGITTGSIVIAGNSMSLSITNPHDTVTVSSIQVVWNSVDGGTDNQSLSLKSASLGDLFWAGTETSGNFTITLSILTIPGNNATSTILFAFDRNYQNPNNTESIAIHLSTPGCETNTIRKP